MKKGGDENREFGEVSGRGSFTLFRSRGRCGSGFFVGSF